MADVNWNGNTSGRGTSEGMPPDIKDKWNWGAFLLCPFWLFAHGKFFLAFLSIMPGINIVAGYKGNEWAWRNIEWKDSEHFQRSQKVWARIGAVLVGLAVFRILLTIIQTLKH
jgi:hypothetical protein